MWRASKQAFSLLYSIITLFKLLKCKQNNCSRAGVQLLHWYTGFWLSLASAPATLKCLWSPVHCCHFSLCTVCLHFHFIMQTCKSPVFTIMNNYLTREDKEIFCLVFTHNYSNWLKRMGKRRNLQSNSNKNTYHTNKKHAISYIFFWRHWLIWYCLIANLILWVIQIKSQWERACKIATTIR